MSDSSASENPNAKDRIHLQGPVFNTRFELVWADPTRYLLDAPAASWGYSEYGAVVGGSTTVWTGSTTDGVLANDCACWTNPLAAADHGSADPPILGGRPLGCQGGGHFLAFGPAQPIGAMAAGQTQLNPVAASLPGPAEWVFNTITNSSWFDLPLSAEVDLAASGGALFSEAKLPGGFGHLSSAPFEVFVADMSLGLFGGNDVVNFTALTGAPVAEFSIRATEDFSPPAGTQGLPVLLKFTSTTGSFAATPITTVVSGDFDGDGDVDGRDFLLWQRNPSVGSLAAWQATYGAGSLTAAVTVPEPTTLLLVSLAALVCVSSSCLQYCLSERAPLVPAYTMSVPVGRNER